MKLFFAAALRVSGVLGFLGVLAVSGAAWAFHDLDCGPFRTSVVNKATGQKRCVEKGPGAQKQFLRFKQLKQEQEQRTRDLLLQQRQQAKAQELIDRQARNKQQQFNRRTTDAQKRLIQRRQVEEQRPALARDRSIKLQEGLKRQEVEATRRRELQRKSDLERQGNLLKQKIDLPRAGLLDNQKALQRRLRKDQQPP